MLATTAAAATPVDEFYLVNPGDTLAVSVWQEEELQQEVLVRPDGYFSFPLAGEIDANSKSVAQIQQRVSEQLHQYIPEAVVTVTVSALSGLKIYVIGQVRRPGEFQLNTNIDVVRALSMAGGTNEFANLGAIKILRRLKGVQQTIPFNYRDIEKGTNLHQNLMLMAGDVVIVP